MRLVVFLEHLYRETAYQVPPTYKSTIKGRASLYERRHCGTVDTPPQPYKSRLELPLYNVCNCNTCDAPRSLLSRMANATDKCAYEVQRRSPKDAINKLCHMVCQTTTGGVATRRFFLCVVFDTPKRAQRTRLSFDFSQLRVGTQIGSRPLALVCTRLFTAAVCSFIRCGTVRCGFNTAPYRTVWFYLQKNAPHRTSLLGLTEKKSPHRNIRFNNQNPHRTAPFDSRKTLNRKKALASE